MTDHTHTYTHTKPCIEAGTLPKNVPRWVSIELWGLVHPIINFLGAPKAPPLPPTGRVNICHRWARNIQLSIFTRWYSEDYNFWEFCNVIISLFCHNPTIASTQPPTWTEARIDMIMNYCSTPPHPPTHTTTETQQLFQYLLTKTQQEHQQQQEKHQYQ